MNLIKLVTILQIIEAAQGDIMSALSDLQAEDTALAATIATVISEWAADLAAANANGDSAAIEQVVTDMKTDAANLTASVPTTAYGYSSTAPGAAPTPPAGSSEPAAEGFNHDIIH